MYAWNHRRSNAHLRRGLTLVELMVVVAMIVVLLGVTLPAIKAALEGRRNREAARIVVSYLMAKQAQASELRRPVGVWIERSKNDTEKSYTLFTAEVPPAYSGDAIGATATIFINGPDLAPGVMGVDDDSDGTVDNATEVGWAGSDDLYAALSNSTMLQTLVHVGDEIKFGYQNPIFQITAISSAGVNFSHGGVLPPDGAVVPYQIIRRPMRSSIASVELPQSTAIDLDSSGIHDAGIEFFGSNSPIVIMFSPQGGLERIYYAPSIIGGVRPSGTVHLLVGNDDELEVNNLEAPDSFWVSVGHISGSIFSTEISDSSHATTTADKIRASRKLARRAGSGG